CDRPRIARMYREDPPWTCGRTREGEMRRPIRPIVSFRGFALDLEAFELRRGGTPVAIARKPLDLLAHLVEHRDRVVTKEELLRQVWPGISVSDHALTSALRDLRRVLGEPLVVTVRGRGYRFAAPARKDEAGDSAPARTGQPFVERDVVMQGLVG